MSHTDKKKKIYVEVLAFDDFSTLAKCVQSMYREYNVIEVHYITHGHTDIAFVHYEKIDK